MDGRIGGKLRFKDEVTVASSDSSFRLLKLMSVLIFLVVGVVIGLISGSHLDRYFNLPGDKYSTKSLYYDTVQFSAVNSRDIDRCKKNVLPNVASFTGLTNLSHQMTDHELFWRATLVPEMEIFPFKRVPKVAFMFLTRGPMPMLPLWERFFAGQDVDKYTIYVHAPPGFELNVSDSSVFYRRLIPSKKVSWGSVSLVDGEKRLLANALLDYSNERFILLSESCIPIYNFPTVYRYLVKSAHSFIESYDDPSRYGRGRYSRWMKPDIRLSEWRKGSQWFEMHRTLAVKIVAEIKFYMIFSRYCKPSCYPDEHYIPTYVGKFYPSLNSNRTVTYVDWSMLSPHPATFSDVNVTVGFINSLRNNGTKCTYNDGETSICRLFARKFHPSALEPLLNISERVMGY